MSFKIWSLNNSSLSLMNVFLKTTSGFTQVTKYFTFYAHHNTWTIPLFFVAYGQGLLHGLEKMLPLNITQTVQADSHVSSKMYLAKPFSRVETSFSVDTVLWCGWKWWLDRCVYSMLMLLFYQSSFLLQSLTYKLYSANN